MPKKSIAAIDPSGKTVLVRVDFNVPQDDEGGITDEHGLAAGIDGGDALLRHGGRSG